MPNTNDTRDVSPDTELSVNELAECLDRIEDELSALFPLAITSSEFGEVFYWFELGVERARAYVASRRTLDEVA